MVRWWCIELIPQINNHSWVLTQLKLCANIIVGHNPLFKILAIKFCQQEMVQDQLDKAREPDLAAGAAEERPEQRPDWEGQTNAFALSAVTRNLTKEVHPAHRPNVQSAKFQ